MKIRWKIQVSGTVHGIHGGVNPGDVTEVDDSVGARYCALHYAEPVVDRKEERAVAPKSEERTGPKDEDEAPKSEDKPAARTAPKPRGGQS